MTIKKGFVTQVGMTLEEAFEQAAAQDFDYVEVMMDGDHERTRLESQLDEIRALLEQYDLGLAVHLPFKLDIGSPQEHVRKGAIKELKACIDVAAGLGAETGVLHASSNAWSAAWSVERIQDLILESVRELSAYGKEQGFTVAVENIPDTFFDIHDFPWLFQETDAVMTLDTGHARISGMESEEMAAFVEEWTDRIAHVHLNDTRRPRDEHLPFGAGNLDFEQILAPIQEDWSGSLSLEVFTNDWEYMQMSKKRLDALL